MKFEIYQVEQPEPEKAVRIGFRRDGDDVLVAVIGASGREAWHIIRIMADGTIYLCGNLSPDIGFQLDERGRVKISNKGGRG